MKKQVLIYLLIAIISFLLVMKYPNTLSWNAQWEILKNLRKIAAWIFGIMGLWLGIVHPDSLKNIFNVNYKPNNDLARAKTIFHPIRNATIIVVLIICIEIFAPVIKQISCVVDNKQLVLNISFFLILFIGMSLIWSLLQTLVPLYESEGNLEDNLGMREKILSKTSRNEENN